MTMIPSDLTSRVGEEVTFGDIFRRAWTTHKKYGMTLALYLLVIGLCFIAASCIISCLVVIGPLALNALVVVPLMAGLSWSVVLTYDGRAPRFNDLFLGFRTRFNSLAVIGLIQAGLQLIPIIVTIAVLGMAALSPMTGGRSGGGGFGSWHFEMTRAVLQIGQSTYDLLLQIVFFLAPLLVFTVAAPKPVDCIKTNLRILANRPGQFLATFFTPVGLGLLILLLLSPLVIGGIMVLAGSKNVPLGVLLIGLGVLLAIPLMIWVTVFGFFLKAAFFRSVCGYTLAEPQPGAPGPFGAAPGTDTPPAPSSPPVAQPVDAWPGDSTPPIELPPEVEGPLPFDEPNPYRPDAPDDRPPQGGAP
ncbi:MAG: hypothetical protein GXY74_04370 [Phycisphaerae bacterium]|nr:hypothetical protein [Phycisphaerae bacterium]